MSTSCSRPTFFHPRTVIFFLLSNTPCIYFSSLQHPVHREHRGSFLKLQTVGVNRFHHLILVQQLHLRGLQDHHSPVCSHSRDARLHDRGIQSDPSPGGKTFGRRCPWGWKGQPLLTNVYRISAKKVQRFSQVSPTIIEWLKECIIIILCKQIKGLCEHVAKCKVNYECFNWIVYIIALLYGILWMTLYNFKCFAFFSILLPAYHEE